MIDYTLLNYLILKLKAYCGQDRQAKVGQYDKEKNRAPSFPKTVTTDTNIWYEGYFLKDHSDLKSKYLED